MNQGTYPFTRVAVLYYCNSLVFHKNTGAKVWIGEILNNGATNQLYRKWKRNAKHESQPSELLLVYLIGVDVSCLYYQNTSFSIIYIVSWWGTWGPQTQHSTYHGITLMRWIHVSFQRMVEECIYYTTVIPNLFINAEPYHIFNILQSPPPPHIYFIYFYQLKQKYICHLPRSHPTRRGGDGKEYTMYILL